MKGSVVGIISTFVVTVAAGIAVFHYQRGFFPEESSPPLVASDVGSRGAPSIDATISVVSPAPQGSAREEGRGNSAEDGATEQITHLYNNDYGGAVWFALMPQEDNWGKLHYVKVVWGPWQFDGYHVLDQYTMFKYFKEYGTSQELTVHVSPAAHVSFGEGDVTGSNVIDTSGAWVSR